MPFVDGVGGLDIIMRIHQHRRLALGVQPVGVKQGMTLGGDDFDMLHPDAA
jgi:hypothetical protein